MTRVSLRQPMCCPAAPSTAAPRSMADMLILDAGAVFEPHAKLTIINDGWLLLEQNTFKGTIKDFGGSDNLDLAKIRFIGQDRSDDCDLYANHWGRRPASGRRGTPHQPTFTWPAPTRPRTSHSRAMERTARWLLLSPMPRWRGMDNKTSSV